MERQTGGISMWRSIVTSKTRPSTLTRTDSPKRSSETLVAAGNAKLNVPFGAQDNSGCDATALKVRGPQFQTAFDWGCPRKRLARRFTYFRSCQSVKSRRAQRIETPLQRRAFETGKNYNHIMPTHQAFTPIKYTFETRPIL